MTRPKARNRMQTTMRFPPRMVAALDEIATKRGVSRTRLVEMAVASLVNRQRRGEAIEEEVDIFS